MGTRKPRRPLSAAKRPHRAPAEQIFLAVVESAFDSIIITDADGSVAYANPASRNLFGVAPAELIGRNVLGLMHPDDAAKVAPVLRERASDIGIGKPATLDTRIRHSTGKWLIAENVVTKLDLPDGRGIVISSRDISDRKRTEALHRGRAHLLEQIATTAPLEQILAELILLTESQADGVRGAIVLFAQPAAHLPVQHGRVQLSVAPSMPPACLPALVRHADSVANTLLEGGAQAMRVDDLQAAPH
ncbi:MAG TPA: PAS domain S-box protein [Burkholderiaceae bacterium]